MALLVTLLLWPWTVFATVTIAAAAVLAGISWKDDVGKVSKTFAPCRAPLRECRLRPGAAQRRAGLPGSCCRSCVRSSRSGARALRKLLQFHGFGIDGIDGVETLAIQPAASPSPDFRVIL